MFSADLWVVVFDHGFRMALEDPVHKEMHKGQDSEESASQGDLQYQIHDLLRVLQHKADLGRVKPAQFAKFCLAGAQVERSTEWWIESATTGDEPDNVNTWVLHLSNVGI